MGSLSSSTFDQHLEHFQTVLDSLVVADLKLKRRKCVLFQRQVKFLGSIVSGDGIEPDPEKVKAVADWPRPQNLTDHRAFVALASYLPETEIARPLHELTKKNVRFYWGSRQEHAAYWKCQLTVEVMYWIRTQITIQWAVYYSNGKKVS